MPLVNSVKEASHVDELFTNDTLNMLLKPNVFYEVAVNFIGNQRVEDDCAALLNVILHNLTVFCPCIIV